MGLEVVEFILDIEDAFGIKIPDSELEKLDTLGNFYDLVVSILSEQRPELLDSPNLEDEVWKSIAHFATRNEHKSSPESVDRQTRFVEDLGYG